MIVKVLFWGKLFKWKFGWIDTLRRPLRKITLAVGLSGCLIHLTPTKIITQIPNLVFYLYIIYKCHLNLYADQGKWRVHRGAQKILIYYGLWTGCECILFYLDCIIYNKINTCFSNARKHVTY